jgi:hypothetical protein
MVFVALFSVILVCLLRTMSGCSGARPARTASIWARKISPAGAFRWGFAREFLEIMHDVHLIEVSEIVGDIGPRENIRSTPAERLLLR